MAKIEVVQYGPFELEVGSPAYHRLIEQDKLTGAEPVTEVEIEPDEAGPRDQEPKNLSSLTRGELNDRALKAGVEDPPSFKTKEDVIQAIQDAEASGSTLE